jgi:hypothetical protein
MKARDFLGRLVMILGIVLVVLAVMAVRVGAQSENPPGAVTPEQLSELLKTLLQPAALLNVAAAALSLIASYVPVWREKWAAKDPTFKSLGMLGAVTGLAVIIGVLSFTKVVAIVTPDSTGLILLVISWGTALWTNSTTYQYSPPVASVVVAKANVTTDATTKAPKAG